MGRTAAAARPAATWTRRATRAVVAPLGTALLRYPSPADEHMLDPTFRRCADFARRWGYGEMVVHHLFAFHSTSP